MIYVLTNKLPDADKNVVKFVFDSINYPRYIIIDVSKDVLPTEEMLKQNKVLCVYSITKAASAFEKKMKLKYHKDIMSVLNFDRIDKPSDFMKSETERNLAWESISKLCKQKIRKINVDLLPDKLPKEVWEAILDKKESILLKGKNNTALNIVPDGSAGMDSKCITFSELVVLMTTRLMFTYSSAEINY